jgi:hypothetical protein
MFRLVGLTVPQGEERNGALVLRPFLYRCPKTGENVQAYAIDDAEDALTYVQVTCLACAQAHLVNPKTGRVLGREGDE